MVSSIVVQNSVSSFSSSSRAFMFPSMRLPPPKMVVDKPSLTASSSYSVAFVSTVKLFGLPRIVMSIMAVCARSPVMIVRIWMPFLRVMVLVFMFRLV